MLGLCSAFAQGHDRGPWALLQEDSIKMDTDAFCSASYDGLGWGEAERWGSSAVKN